MYLILCKQFWSSMQIQQVYYTILLKFKPLSIANQFLNFSASQLSQWCLISEMLLQCSRHFYIKILLENHHDFELLMQERPTGRWLQTLWCCVPLCSVCGKRKVISGWPETSSRFFCNILWTFWLTQYLWWYFSTIKNNGIPSAMLYFLLLLLLSNCHLWCIL